LAISAIADLLVNILRPVRVAGASDMSRLAARLHISVWRLSMTHTRENNGLLAAAEKRLLIAIAVRLPGWLSSDHLTLLGLLSMWCAGVAFAHIGTAGWGAAAVAIALLANWFGDSLDGTVARVRQQERPRYGFYVDHVIDLAGTVALLAGMGASGRMSVWIAVAVMAAYFLVSAEAYLATHAASVFRMSFYGIGPTELRVVLAGGAFYAAQHEWIDVAGVHARLLDVSGLIAVAGLAVAFAVSAVRNTRALYLAEPLPCRAMPPAAFERAAGPSGVLRLRRAEGSHCQKASSF
jgi:archaetidylinositol phosphate synthase